MRLIYHWKRVVYEHFELLLHSFGLLVCLRGRPGIPRLATMNRAAGQGWSLVACMKVNAARRCDEQDSMHPLINSGYCLGHAVAVSFKGKCVRHALLLRVWSLVVCIEVTCCT
jgi:hypothetical protein